MMNNKKDFFRQYRDKYLRMTPISFLRTLALKELEEETLNQVEEILLIQEEEIKRTLKTSTNSWCYILSFEKFSKEAKNIACKKMEEAGYKVTENKIFW